MINKIAHLIVFLIALLILNSCDEPFSPYGKFETKYSLNCIVGTDTSLQIATLFQSYSLNDKTPISTSFVHNAFIRLWRGKDDIYILKDSILENTDSTNNSDPLGFYYTNNFLPHPNDSLEIELLLPDGNRLKSKTKVPSIVNQDYDRSSLIIPPQKENAVTFAWTPNGENQIFIPTLKLFYIQNIDGNKVTKRMQIPWEYLTKNGKEIGIDKPPSRMPLVKYSMENIERVLKSISEGDINKNNYFILSAILELKVFGKNLSAYYLTTRRIFDNYSVRLDTQDFSNINGGFGVFGAFTIQKMALLFDDSYVAKFGYENFY